MMDELVRKQDVIDAIHKEWDDVLVFDESGSTIADCCEEVISNLPSIKLSGGVSEMQIEYVYCAVNSKNEIQWVNGSSKKTKYYATNKYVTQAVEYHNKYYPNDVWHVAKFELKEVDNDCFR